MIRLGKRDLYKDQETKMPEIEPAEEEVKEEEEEEKDLRTGRMNVKGIRKKNKYAMKNLNRRR